MYNWPLMKNAITWKDKLSLIKFIAFNDQFTNGATVKKFEESWNKWLGSNHSLFVTSGSTANLLLVSAIKEKFNLKAGSKVLLPSCTWVTTVCPFIQMGFQPIFCDINLTDYSFDINHMKSIASRHKDISVVSVTHLLGFRANVEAYKEIFPNAIFIEDLCESHGCTNSNNAKQGANSLGATFSFYFGHHMTTIEGGMVSSNDEDLHELMNIKRSHGMARLLPKDKFIAATEKWPEVNPKFLFLTDAFNFRNTELNAVLGINQLARLDDIITKRRENYRKFISIISNYEDIFRLPSIDNTNSNFALPFILHDASIKSTLIDEFEKSGIETRPIVSGNLLLQPFLQNYKLEPNSSNNISTLHNCGFYIGNNQYVDDNDFDLLTRALNRVKGLI